MLATTPITTPVRPSSLHLPYGSYPSRQYFDGDTDPTDSAKPPVKTDPPGDPADLGDKGKAALDTERTARKAAEKAAKDAGTKLAQIVAAEQKRKDEDAEQQGEWQKLAEDRKAEIDKIKADAEADVATARAEIARRDRDDRARAALKAAGLDESLLSRIHGDTADELKKDAEELTKLVQASAPKPRDGNGPNPHATGPAGDAADEAALKRTRQTSRL